MSLFNFFKTPANRGVGTGNLSLALSQTPPIQSMYGPRYNVQRSMAPCPNGAAMKLLQVVPTVPIEGNGSYLAGQLALQSLLAESVNK